MPTEELSPFDISLDISSYLDTTVRFDGYILWESVDRGEYGLRKRWSDIALAVEMHDVF